MSPPPPKGTPAIAGLPPVGQRAAFASLLPYLWPKGETGLKARVVLAVVCLIVAKAANVYIPILFKGLVDALTRPENLVIAVPVGLLLAYGLELSCRKIQSRFQSFCSQCWVPTKNFFFCHPRRNTLKDQSNRYSSAFDNGLSIQDFRVGND